MTDHAHHTYQWPRDQMVPTPETDLSLDQINLADPSLWARDDMDAVLALRREELPITQDEHRSTGSPFWSLTRWDHIAAVTSDSTTFSSIHGVAAANEPGDAHAASDTMIVMDPPLHTKARKLVNRGFTPRQVRALAPAVDRRVEAMIEDLRQKPTDANGYAHTDFVEDVAVRLPAAVICDMMGIPESDQNHMVDLTSRSLNPNGYGIHRDEVPTIAAEIDAYGLELAQSRIDNPTEDLTSLLVNGQIADAALAPDEIGAFFRLLVLAGNETTRNGLSHGMLTLSEWPDERQRWQDALGRDDEEDVAWSGSEEIVRWSSPVIHMKRNATRDAVIGDPESGEVEVAEGEKIVMWYTAANRDHRRFHDPYRFDILRSPNHQGGFGTGGAHFCLGANLARREIAITMTELLRAFPDIDVDGPIEKARSNFLHIITALPVRYTPT
ncbi:MAG: cytochrome P450 [Actinomycetota bacterium]|jgi:cytochrome P450|nr:cytochrome P450 [Actinomycetota bacterium]